MLSAVLLAGGLGTRAWPYAGVRQKVTLPVLNTPLVRRLALDLAALGVTETVVVVGHRAQAVRGCLADLPGVRFVEQRQPAGTADAALHGLEATPGEDVLVCNGDIVLDRLDLKRIVDAHASNGAGATLLTAGRLPSAAIVYAVLMGRDGAVHSVQPRTADGWHGLCFGGIVAARKDLLRTYLLRNPGIIDTVGAGGMPPAEAELCCSLDMMAREDGNVAAVRAVKGIVDVDKPWQLPEANLLAGALAMAHVEEPITLGEGASVSDKATIDEGVKVVLGKGARIGDYCHIRSSVVLADGAKLLNGAMVRNDGAVFVGPNVLVQDYCLIGGRSVLGSRTVVGHGADFIGITFDDVSIRHPAQLCAVLGSKVNIAGGVMTGNWRFDNAIKTQRTGKHREKPEHFGELTYIGDYVRTGNNVVFAPGTRVGSYSCIGPG
ncbi:MAG: sugar phosphate nucleotidyltransferase, partial [FCB group bacterium]|nr:sugar phosphate nucleotidyltransferase [FCB group bacterium]